MIEFDKVNKWYGDYHALVDVSETIARGEVVVVCGPSGSGKSTLIRTINRLEPIKSGRITVDGKDIHARGIDLNEFRSHIGFVFQQFNLFPHLTVIGNCTLAPIQLRGLSRAEATERAMALLDRVGLANKADAFPSELSGGQQQRVAIARALAMQPPLSGDARDGLRPRRGRSRALHGRRPRAGARHARRLLQPPPTPARAAVSCRHPHALRARGLIR
ncbi:ABC-type polar amino acid transport system ATPase subunit [Variovorax guangxiensis]|nr:ABC-type polar amino acid transport system ATPase subunit [Variovorax guangxiensis]